MTNIVEQISKLQLHCHCSRERVMFGMPSTKREGQTMLNMCMEQCEGVYLMDEIERLREALREIYEVYAGSEGIPQPMTAAEGYLLSLVMEAVSIAQESLKEKE